MRDVKDFLDEFHIGTYFLQRNARSEAHVRDLKDCGIDLVFGMDRDEDALALFEKYGVSAVVTGAVPGWFGGNGDNAGTMRMVNPKEAYISGAESFADHPAILGIDIGDEPSSRDFPYYGEVVRLLHEKLPEQFLYLNIYPSYGMLADSSKEQIEKELGTNTYAAYLQSYCENVDLPYLSFDHYMYSSDRDRLVHDLQKAAAFCKKYGKKLFAVLQVNSREADVFISEDGLRFQAYTALAFGASVVTWACYCAGWWHNQVLDSAGEKTEQYEKLRRVNKSLLRMTEDYMTYRWEKTEQLSFGETVSFGAFEKITADKAVFVGQFLTEDGKAALFVSPAKETAEGDTVLRFTARGDEQVFVNRGEGKERPVRTEDGNCAVTLHGMEACFITMG